MSLNDINLSNIKIGHYFYNVQYDDWYEVIEVLEDFFVCRFIEDNTIVLPPMEKDDCALLDGIRNGKIQYITSEEDKLLAVLKYSGTR